ncbi:MAG TPA: PEGA domain-containing protein [Candidatus Acidoferrales bacterium]|nr:PEGA domain-containing protein [Candidatus Acidoferrales bacterium]
MKVLISLVLSAALVCPGTMFAQASSPPEKKADQQPPQPQETSPQPPKLPPAFGLEDATPVRLKLTRTISSADAKTGDRIDFEVLEDVKAKDLIIIPRGGIAWGTVTEAHPKRRMGRGGKLDVNIDSVRLVDGEKVPLRAVKDVQGGGHVGVMTGAIVASAIVFFPAAPFFLFMHGKDITIPEGTEITAYINGDIPLERARFLPQTSGNAAANSSGPTTPSQPATAVVQVRSAPDGADITVDDKFVGNTPSELKLPPGDHKIRVEKSGFKPWERILTVVVGASITVDAKLEPQ